MCWYYYLLCIMPNTKIKKRDEINLIIYDKNYNEASQIYNGTSQLILSLYTNMKV